MLIDLSITEKFWKFQKICFMSKKSCTETVRFKQDKHYGKWASKNDHGKVTLIN